MKTETDRSAMLRWLKMWDRPEKELRGNLVLEHDENVDRFVDEAFKRCTAPEESVA
jgi:hypothetical protein